MNRLEKAVADLLKESSPVKQSTFQAAIDQSRAHSAQVKESFNANSKYQVEVLLPGMAIPLVRTFVEALRARGFKTAEFPAESATSQAATWSVPVSTFKNARGPVVLYARSEKTKAEEVARLIESVPGGGQPTLVEKGTGAGEFIGVYFPSRP